MVIMGWYVYCENRIEPWLNELRAGNHFSRQCPVLRQDHLRHADKRHLPLSIRPEIPTTTINASQFTAKSATEQSKKLAWFPPGQYALRDILYHTRRTRGEPENEIISMGVLRLSIRRSCLGYDMNGYMSALTGSESDSRASNGTSSRTGDC